MQLILLQKVVNLGGLGDKVNVRAGYGRNFLIPYGKAVPATAENVAMFEARRAEFEAKANDLLSGAEGRKAKLEGLTVNISANASPEGKLYGSVGPREIVMALHAAGHEAEKSEIVLAGPIRNTGEFSVQMNLHADVEVQIKLVISPEA